MTMTELMDCAERAPGPSDARASAGEFPASPRGRGALTLGISDARARDGRSGPRARQAGRMTVGSAERRERGGFTVAMAFGGRCARRLPSSVEGRQESVGVVWL